MSSRAGCGLVDIGTVQRDRHPDERVTPTYERDPRVDRWTARNDGRMLRERNAGKLAAVWRRAMPV